MERRRLCILLVVSLLGNALCVPLDLRQKRSYGDEVNSRENDLATANSDNTEQRQDDPLSVNSLDSPKDTVAEADSPSKVSVETTTRREEYASPVDSDEDDDDFDEPIAPSSTTGGGSNIFSLLRLANAFFPSSSSGGNILIQSLIREFLTQNQLQFQVNGGHIINKREVPSRRYEVLNRRQNVLDNEIDIDYTDLKPLPLQRQETEENNSESTDSNNNSRSDNKSESLEDNNSDDDDNDDDHVSDENNAAEESVENKKPEKNGNGNNNGNGNKNGNGDSKSKQDSNGDDSKSKQDSKGDASDEFDSDEPPEGDGQGGGILGILAGLSGGEDGQSDLGSLLAAFSGIIANLSGDGFDLNALIASALGLFVGLLSEGEENPGAVIASYLLTSLDTITGGGSQNNGAFFGTFLSKLISGTSAGGDPNASSEENGGERPKDSGGFFASFLMALLGEMSKMSTKSSSSISCSSCHEGWQERIFNFGNEGLLN